MAKDRDNPFYLPIGLTGIGQEELSGRGLGIGLLGMIVVGIAAITAKALGWSRVSLWTLLSDAAFLLVRIPRGFQTFVSDVQSSGWGIPVLLVGLFVLVYSTNSLLTSSAGFMARRLSLRDRFPLSEQQARKAGLTLTFFLIIAIVGGGIAWFGLLLPSDSTILRIVRLIAISFLVQIACMLIGGAMACSQAEGKTGSEALYRMASLAWLEKGRFLRAAVYTLPRWLGVSLVSWCTVFAAITLPFLIARYLLPLWLSFLGPVESTALHIGRIILVIIGGLLLLVLWGALLKKNPHPLLRLISIVGLVATLWCLFILPFFVKAIYLDSSRFWFSAAWHHLMGHPVTPVPWQFTICFSLVGVILFLNTATILSIWLFLYPLASGVCTFFSLRRGAEGKDYRSATGTTQAVSKPLFSAPGTFLFTSGGTSALASLSPPRGWMALTWSGIRPGVFILTLLFAFSILAWIFGIAQLPAGWKHTLWGVGAVLLSSMFLPIMCRGIASSLDRKQPKKSGVPAHALPFRTFVTWLYFLMNIAFIAVGIGIGASLGLIPWVGPILWGAFYLFMILGANIIVASLVRWIPGSMILPAVAANDIGPLERTSEILKRTDHYAGAAPWTFLGAMAAGLPFSLAPALVAVGVFLSLEFLYAPIPGQQWLLALHYILGSTKYEHTFMWQLLGIWCVLGMVLLALGVALTNAYLIIRQSVSSQTP